MSFELHKGRVAVILPQTGEQAINVGKLVYVHDINTETGLAVISAACTAYQAQLVTVQGRIVPPTELLNFPVDRLLATNMDFKAIQAQAALTGE